MLKKISLVFFLLTSSYGGSCVDSSMTNVAMQAMKANYSSYDGVLSTVLKKVKNHLEDNLELSKETLLITQEMKKLHSRELLELKEILFLNKNINEIIYKQR